MDDRDYDDLDDDDSGSRWGGRGGGRRYGGGDRRRGGGGGRRRTFHRELLNQVKVVDYKDIDTLRNFLTEQGKIRPRRQTNVSAKQQRSITQAVKRARHMALLPFHADHDR